MSAFLVFDFMVFLRRQIHKINSHEVQVNEAADAYERAIRRAHSKAAVVRALSLWETWIIMGSVAYLVGRILF